jgi:acetylornithine/succinyldiaminopimelate/putrescine aminotransferase
MTLRKVVVSASNATLINVDGSTHADLFGANGTLLLGHSNPAVVRTLAAQNEKVWITGRLATDIAVARDRVGRAGDSRQSLCFGILLDRNGGR